MSDPTTSWPVLSPLERRLLGVLVEKAKTTPDVYPMSLNSLVAGCNQKTNRDPLMNLDDVDAEEALEAMMPKGLVYKVTGGRVDRWRQALYEIWIVSKVQLAVIAELLLRGPQTEGELRGRAARMEPIDDLDQLRDILKPLVDRKIVVYLTRERSRGTVLTHGFHSPEEWTRLRTQHSFGSSAEESAVSVPRPVSMLSTPTVIAPSAPDRSAEAFAEIARLDGEVRQLRAELIRVTSMVVDLRESLGIEAKPSETPR